MGHSLDPGPRALEVTAAAAELATEDWQLPGGASLRASPSVCGEGGAGDQCSGNSVISTQSPCLHGAPSESRMSAGSVGNNVRLPAPPRSRQSSPRCSLVVFS